jgi:hypothetical protein
MSTNSVEDEGVDLGIAPMDWHERLDSTLKHLEDRKGYTVAERENHLASFVRLLRHHFAEDQIAHKVSDIMPNLLKSVRRQNGGSVAEQTWALKALAVIFLTCPAETAYEDYNFFQVLKSVTSDAEAEPAKVEAIHALSIAAIFGGGSDNAFEEVMDFYMEIIEADGATVDAADSGLVVTAALQAWGLVATYADYLSDQSEEAMEAFIDQLDSTDVEVQNAAGVDIALIFEAARQHEEETGESVDMQYNQHRIMTRMNELVRESSKSISRKDRKSLRANFASIVTSLEQGKGPGYSTAGRGGMNPHTGGQKTEGDGEFQEFGYRQKIRVEGERMTIDSWVLLARVDALKRVFGSGFAAHFTENPQFHDVLRDAQVEHIPDATSRKKVDGSAGAKKGRKAVRGAEYF